MIFTDNRASFHLRREEYLAKYQKVPKYFEHNCSTKPFHGFDKIAI